MSGATELEIIACPYMPKDFIAMKDATGIVVQNVNTGYTFRIPPISLDLDFSKEYKADVTAIVGQLLMKAAWGNK